MSASGSSRRLPHGPLGAHVRDEDPVGTAEAVGAEVVQLFLSDPQGWATPQPHQQSELLQQAGVSVFVHTPYVINVASLNNRIRIPSRKSVVAQAACAADVGAEGIIVHGGHVRAGEDVADGIENWRKLFARQAEEGGFPVPVLVENTAGGEHAMARYLDTLARLWDRIGEFAPGFCLDTCHAWAAGLDLTNLLEQVRGITGGIDLVHLNNSRDEFGSARDRHASLREGRIDPELLVEICRQAEAPAVLETPTDTQEGDLAFLRERLG